MMKNNDFASYVDDNTPYTVGNYIEDVIQRLWATSGNIFRWFHDNKKKANTDKCHFICSSNQKANLTVENE